MQTLVGCSILLVVTQSAAFAKGPGNSHAMSKPNQGGTHNFSANTVRSSNVMKTQILKTNVSALPNSSATGVKIVNTKNFPTQTTTGGIKKFPDSTKVTNPGVILLPPKVVNNPPSGGSKFPGGTKLPPGSIFQPPRITDPPLGGGPKTPPMGGGTGNPPAGGGSNPPSGGTMPPSKDCHHHSCFPNWLWYTPALYSNWGLGYAGGYSGNYCASPMFVNNISSAPVMIDSTPAAPLTMASAANDKLTLKMGQNYAIANDNFGEAAGNLALQVNGLTLPVRVDKWDAQQVSFTLPAIGLAQASEGMFQIIKADHSVSKSVPVMVVTAQ
jgi:hypothetical protein